MPAVPAFPDRLPPAKQPERLLAFRNLTSNLDIYRCAKLLIDQHGEDAARHAAMRADALLEAGDMDGYAVWKRIVKVVEELVSKERPEGAPVQ